MKKKIYLTTAQALIKFLNQQYISIDGEETPFVEGVFQIFGHGNVLGIGEALEENPGHLNVFQGKNEQGMANAAVAFAKQSLRKKIYAVTASSGPGSTNLVTSAAAAYANNIPVLLLPADTFASRQPDPVLQQLECPNDGALTVNDSLKSVSRYWDRVQRPEQLMSALIKGFEVLTNPDSAGPVTIAISQDTEGEAYGYPIEFFNKKIHYMDRRKPSEREIKQAAKEIKSSKRPVIIVGGGAKYSEAREELIEFSEKYNIPLVSTHAGKSTIESSFKNDLGGVGVLGTSAANRAVMESDLIIGIGTRYTDFVTSSKTIFNLEQTKFLNINVNRFQTYKFDAVSVVGDAKKSLQMIIPLLENYQSEFGNLINEFKKEWLSERERLANTNFNRENFLPEIHGHFNQEILNEYSDALNTELTQTETFIKLNDLVDDDAIVVASAGSLPGDMQRLWNSNSTNTYHLEYGYSTMGYEVAGALGAKLAAPEQEVYSILGDGSFLMLHTELVTSIQYGKKINVVLFDNSGYGCINNLQMGNGSNSYGTELRDHNQKIMKIDYAKLGEVYGAKTYSIRSLEELEAAVKDARKQTVSTLFDIKVLPKTMSGDSEGSWWNVGVSEQSTKEQVLLASKERKDMLDNAKRY